MTTSIQKIVFLSLAIGLSACFKESALPVKAAFDINYVGATKSAPVKIQLVNTSVNADFYKWTFEGANITSSDLATPPELTFDKTGSFKIKLEARNQDNLSDVIEKTVEVGAVLKAKFSFEYDINNIAPAKVQFKNLTTGATKFEWTFEKADKTSSIEKDPVANYLEKGVFKVSLTAIDGARTSTFDSVIVIKEPVSAGYTYSVLDYNFGLEAPLTLRLINTSKSSTQNKWSINDTSIKFSSETDSIVTVTLTEAKKYKISMAAGNGKETKTFEKEIEVSSKTNLLYYKDIKFGVFENSTYSPYFISRRNLSIEPEKLDTLGFGKELDLVFFSQDESLFYSRFISPDKATNFLMTAVPKAQQTTFINLLEGCAACTQISDLQFDGIKTSKDFDAFVFKFSDGVVEGFDKTKTPRYVPFKTADGRIGIIKIKSTTILAGNSFITTDIKVFRKP
jgi:PKD repeat protein